MKRINLIIILILSVFPNFVSARNFAMVITGIGGGEPYDSEFRQTASETARLLVEREICTSDTLKVLADINVPDDCFSHSSTLDNIRLCFNDQAQAMTAEDTFLLILIGHGQSNFLQPKFNLPGPDLSGEELNELLNILSAKDQRIILSFACSGHILEQISSQQRCIIASSDGPLQIQFSHMHRFLLDALKIPSAPDIDGDRQITFDELYEYLSLRVQEDFKSRSVLELSTVALDDNGDRTPTTQAVGMALGDGDIASEIIFYTTKSTSP